MYFFGIYISSLKYSFFLSMNTGGLSDLSLQFTQIHDIDTDM